ncbi:Nuclear factor of activated T-cells 5 [Orchesella cincta]|uniref:Nuclear factor of activated T-cells 5 n=1 Tax=Orchesella cincta TaxID=48709 RepID=A0A1D2MWF1_ORCCI|nr:Nuclear factor of activated T-cells 5 [Orchesella cincta]
MLELYEEPALDGIPISGKTANISGFGFAKGITTTATTNTSLKGLIVDSLPTSSLPASALVSVVPQQTQQVLDSQQPLKLMQLTENVRMSPDSTEPRVTVSSSTLPFAAHQVTRQMSSAPIPTQMGTNPTSPTSTTSNPSPSPIPIKRSRFSFAHPAASKGTGLKLRNQNQNQNYMPSRSVGKRLPPGTTPTLTSNLAPYTRDGRAQLQIVSQPEEQHRARYQTEGSRGAIKDRKGNGFPTVKLVGYDKPATLQIFIGSDQGKISPHMFYQACKVTGKSSTPCIEKKVEGTILIEIEFEPSKEMVISCDCVGILKERNVDVEQRFPFHHASQSRKKSTKCRMIFRTTVINSDGMEETVQAASLPILCTQPPGVPEICKQSLTECPASGGLELFVVGKNFLKDTRVVFQQEDTEGHAVWEASSEPLKDYLQQNHLICPVPAFKEEKIVEPVECKVLVVSGGKHSEPHRFTYLPELVNAL